ncbi:hypothetical protein ACRALDRAFT_2039034 [Sodiomyces alcalophilus JCM 7366]|uniref:uncharacterized protein n=1 Tax=Sodiomyces alcalophilus JCM 7366 TaxID=591952 RepID=UPI0039B526E6
MTKQTPESLRARASNLSLRMQALSGPNSPAATPRPAKTPTAPRPNNKPIPTEFIIADMANRPASENLICAPCLSTIPPPNRPVIHHVVSTDTCRLCALRTGDPAAYTKPFCDFMTDNPTVFHTVAHFRAQLTDAGFEELPARASWSDRLRPGGKYWTTRNGSALIAFTVGSSYQPGNGVAMIAGHIDALTARLKPVSARPNAAGYVQLGVAPYSGALNSTWWDRDLSIGGRVVVRDPSSGKTSTRLVKLGWPIARIPSLAPHFGVGMTGSNNKETEMVPIIGLDNSDLAGTDAAAAAAAAAAEPIGPPGSFVNSQPPKLVKLIASELGLDSPSSILDWELELYDSQPAQTGGMDREFIFAPRIDDKLCSWSALTALLASSSSLDHGHIKLVALFDNEEIGSLLRQGARGNFLPQTIERAVESLASSSSTSVGTDVMARTYAASFLLSADVSHAGNPNFLSRYLDGHVPRLNVGLAVSADPNGHMTTDAVSSAILRRVAERSGCRLQVFQIRNDSRSGGTVGPMLSAAMGVRAADAGLPQLSMHSIRATTGSLDPGLGVKIFKSLLDHWEEIDAEWQ